MLRSVRFALSSPRRRRRRRRHFLLPAARLIALIPEGSRIRTCAPLSKRETPTCEQRAACRATDARLLRRPTLCGTSTSPTALSLQESILVPLAVGRKKEREKKECPFSEGGKIVFIYILLSLSLSFALTPSPPFTLFLDQSPFLFISVLLHERIVGPNMWLPHVQIESRDYCK